MEQAQPLVVDFTNSEEEAGDDPRPRLHLGSKVPRVAVSLP